MIDLIIAVGSSEIMVVFSDGLIANYQYSIETFINKYISSIFISFKSLLASNKQVKQVASYKRPLVFYANNKINVFIPVNALRKRDTILISLEYCLNHTCEDFIELTGYHVSSHSWSRLISTGLAYRNSYSLNLEIPSEFVSVNKETFKERMKS